MDNKILEEITNFCEECPSHDCCPEDDCVLWRIEQLITNKKDKEYFISLDTHMNDIWEHEKEIANLKDQNKKLKDEVKELKEEIANKLRSI